MLECEEGVPKVFFFSIQKGRLTLSGLHFKLFAERHDTQRHMSGHKIIRNSENTCLSVCE